MAVGEHAADLVELAHHGLALKPATAGSIPGAEHLDRALQRIDLLRPHGGRLVAVEADLVEFVEGVGSERGVVAWGAGRCRIGVQPVVHGAGECGTRGERSARTHQAASVEHEVHSREFREDRCGPFGSPRQTVHGLPLPRAAGSCEPEVLDGYDTAEALGEQGSQNLGHRIARGLPHVDPAPHS